MQLSKTLKINFLFRWYILATAAILINCSGASKTEKAPVESTTTVVFDIGLMPDWDTAKKDESSAYSPAYYVYQKNNKTLIFMASRHSNKQSDPAFLMIDTIFKSEIFNAIIVESFPASLGVSPLVYDLTQINKDGFFPNGEPSYVVQKAINSSIPYIGGETDSIGNLNLIKSKDFTENDYLAFLFLRSLAADLNSGIVDSSSDIKNYFEKHMAARKKVLNLSDNLFKWDNFLNWYQINFKKKFILSDINTSLTASFKSSALITQRIGYYINKGRDELILKITEDMLNKYNSVLVVYGSSHYRTQKPVIENYFGPPVKKFFGEKIP